MILAKKKKVKVGAKARKVLKEFGAGTLKTSAGKKVTNQKQAFAIAMSEQRRAKKKHKKKK
uniref:Uncharacterized protein n=1 Tax=viral metagenome TaxID=1070528 RepID=A0A6H1ZK09_9ZZZZ